MRESVIFQDILQEGRREEALQFLKRLLKRKLGTIHSSILERLQVMTTEELEVLGEELLDFSKVSDLELWLNRQSERSGAFRIVSRLLKRKFGDIDSSILERIQVMTIDDIETLGENLLDFSNISDLEVWLNR